MPLFVAPGEARSPARDLLDHGVVLTQRMGTGMPCLRLAAAYVSARRAGAQVEVAAALFADVRAGRRSRSGCMGAHRLVVDDRRIKDFHGQTLLRYSVRSNTNSC